jgi:E3 ubiquitin-protein ligase DOA10
MSRRQIQFHFQHITSKIPKHLIDIYEKKKKIPKQILPIKNHILYEFCPSVTPVIEEVENGLVDVIVDNYMNMGELYQGEQYDSEKNIEYNPMNFSLRHYISSK